MTSQELKNLLYAQRYQKKAAYAPPTPPQGGDPNAGGMPPQGGDPNAGGMPPQGGGQQGPSPEEIQDMVVQQQQQDPNVMQALQSNPQSIVQSLQQQGLPPDLAQQQVDIQTQMLSGGGAQGGDPNAGGMPPQDGDPNAGGMPPQGGDDPRFDQILETIEQLGQQQVQLATQLEELQGLKKQYEGLNEKVIRMSEQLKMWLQQIKQTANSQY